MKRRDWLLILTAFGAAVPYLLLAWARGAVGFPLDDAWIHQVFARSLATRGEFAFFEGQPSAGSTSPLWTVLLSLGYFLHVDFHLWTMLLGASFLGASAIVAARLAERFLLQFHASQFSRFSLFLPLFLLFEWHLVWSAASGMEISQFVFLSLILLERLYARERAWLLGVIAGLLTLTRPEGVVLAGLVGIGIVVQSDEPEMGAPGKTVFFNRATASNLVVGFRATLRTAFRGERKAQRDKSDSVSPGAPGTSRALGFSAVQFAIGLGVVVAPYLLFNLATSGTVFPNTFYAKNAEYAILFERVPFAARWLQLLFVPWIGAQILLLPGALYGVSTLVSKRQWRALIPFAWLLLLPTLYALRLPVDYQHGRYEMPIVPFVLLYGIWGTALLLGRLRNFVVRATWTISVGVLLIVFWLVGASQYATDVQVIDCEMVQTARWVAANVPADAVVAAHDIGALGYYYQRPFIDLAGLVTPEVIPFIRDEGRLRDYLFARHATFVVVFPGWYPTLDSDPRFSPAYSSKCQVTREQGEQNVVVYQIRLTDPR